MTIDDKIRYEKLQYDINREAAKLSALSSGKSNKYEFLTSKDIFPSDQSRIIEQAKFTYSPLGNAFEKQTKTIEEQGKKQKDAITNQNTRLEALTNKDGYKEIVDKIVKEKLSKIEELTNEMNHNDLIYCFKNNTTTKDFNDFEKIVELSKNVKFGEMKLEDGKELQNIFKTNMNEISKGRFKSEEQKSALENIKLIYKSQQAVIKLFNDYSPIVPQAK